MTTLYFLRHGETEWNLNGNRYCGHTDIPLSETGYRQASQAAEALRNIHFTAMYCSPLLRSRETAGVLADGRDLPCRFDRRLIEIDFGDWEGKTRGEIEEEDPRAWSQWMHNPEETPAGHNGENALQVYGRACAFVDEVSKKYLSDSILVIGHNTLNRVYIAGSLGMPISNYRRILQSNGGISVLGVEDSSFQWLRINESNHLTL